MSTELAAGLVAYRNVRPASAIDEYSRHLVGALCAAGELAEYVQDGLASMRRRTTPPRWILLQYNPFSYGRWGFGPGLVRDAISVRRRWPHTLFAVMVHESWVGMHDWRSTLMGGYQRAQLRSLLRIADRVIVAREALGRRLGGAPACVPVASNITPIQMPSPVARDRLGFGAELVVTLFGTANPDRALEHAEAAIEALAARRGPGGVRVLNLGREAPAIGVPQGVDVRRPGRLHAAELSLRLRASDILLLPLADGLSTRRTTMMAGLAHGVPTAGLCGADTDRILIDHPAAVMLTPVGDPAAFARATVQLSDDPVRLRAMGDAGRRMYRRHFDWPLLAARVIGIVRR